MRRAETLILCYHRIDEGVDDALPLCVSPANFASQLDEIALRYQPSTLDELSSPSRRTRVVVTFDDGYVDNLTNALPIAEAREVPITVFVTSGALGGKGFWWDRLATLLHSRPSAIREIRLATSVGSVRIELGSSKASADLEAVRQHLLPLPVTEIHGILDSVSEQWATSAAPPPGARTLTSSELRQLAASDVVTIGAHTVDHVRLSSLPAQDQLRTISSSREELGRLSGQAISHFAYPYGGRDSFDDDSVHAVRSAGFKTASTTIPGNARLTSDPFRLPRRIVLNWGRLRFRASLERWRLVPQH